MPRKERHVVPNPDGGWDSKREHAERASKHFETKTEAMEWSRNKSREEHSELIPHRKDGVIKNPDSQGTDQNPPKDKG